MPPFLISCATANVSRSPASEPTNHATEGTHFEALAPSNAESSCEKLIADFLRLTWSIRETYAQVEIHASSPQGTVADLVAKGLSVERALKEKGVPESSWHNYDLKTGRFIFNSPKPLYLALESGDAKLDTLLIRWSDDVQLNHIGHEYFKTLIGLMKADPQLKLMVDADPEALKLAQKEIAELPPDLKSRINFVDYHRHDIWYQNPSKPTAEGLLQVVAPNARIKAKEIKSVDTQFTFMGGNIVVGAKNIFVGPQVVEDAMRRFHVSRAEALDALANEFGKPVLQIGDKEIDYDIDVTMAVVRDRNTHEEVILLDSHEKAMELICGVDMSAMSQGDLKNFYQTVSRMAHDPKNRGKQGIADLQTLLENINEKAFVEREQKLRQLRKDFIGRGYKVLLLPGIHQYLDVKKTLPSTAIFNYTNSIFSGSHAIIPEFGIPEWDLYVEQQMRDLGYTNTVAPVSLQSFCRGGGPRCLSQTFRVPVVQRVLGEE